MTSPDRRIATVEDALAVLTHVLTLTTDALTSYRQIVQAQLAGAKPSEHQLRQYVGNLEVVLTALAQTQTLVDMTRELRARLADTDDDTVH